MKYSCITTMNQDYYNHIGKYMIKSWLHYWKDYTITVYVEDFQLPITDDRIIQKDWWEYCFDSWRVFDINCDDNRCKKFAKKGFSFLDSLENPIAENLIWLDADLIFKKPMDDEILNKVAPNKKLISLFDCFYQHSPNYTLEEYLNTSTRPFYAAETGFMVINTNHKNYNEFVKNYRTLYTSEKMNEKIIKWYDTEVTVLSAFNFLDQINDLSKLRTTNKTQTPLNKTWLGEYVSHQKGKVKENAEWLKTITDDLNQKMQN